MLRNKCTLHCKCALCICLSLSRSVISSKSNQIHTQNGLSKEITIRIVSVCVCVDWIQSFHQKQRYYIYSLCYDTQSARIRDILYIVVWLTWRFIDYCKSRTAAAAAAVEKVECWAYAFYWYIRRHLNQSTALDIFGRALTHLRLMHSIYKWLTWHNVQFFPRSSWTGNTLPIYLAFDWHDSKLKVNRYVEDLENCTTIKWCKNSISMKCQTLEIGSGEHTKKRKVAWYCHSKEAK